MKTPNPMNMITNIMMKYQKEHHLSSTHTTKPIKLNIYLLATLLVTWLDIGLQQKKQNLRDFNPKHCNLFHPKFSEAKLYHKNLSDFFHREASNWIGLPTDLTSTSIQTRNKPRKELHFSPNLSLSQYNNIFCNVPDLNRISNFSC